MLSVLRQNANNWFILLMLAIIVVVFIFTFGSWGGGDVSGEMPVAATINGRVVSQAQFNALYSSTFEQMRRFRQNYTIDNAKEDDLKGTVLDRLIGVELLAQEAEERGIYISDEEVVDEVKRQYFPNREFNLEDYQRIVNGIFQTNEARFEEQVRRQLMGRRLEEVLQESQQVSPAEVRGSFDDRYNRVDLNVLRIDPQFWKKSFTEPTDAEAGTWADANKGKVEGFYNERINRFRKPKQVKASHILIKVEEALAGEEKEKALKAAREKLAQAKQKLDSGEEWIKVAKEFSEDPGKDKGGDLGWFAKGDMLGGEFEDAAFSLGKGKHSGVVSSRQGLHIVRVDDIKEASKQELDEVKVEIARQLMRDDFMESQARTRAEKALADLKAGTKLEELKIDGYDGVLTERPDDRLAPRIEATGWFNQKARFVPRVGISDEVVDVAFTLTKENPVAPAVFEVTGRLYVFTLKDREAPDQAKFEAERDTLEDELLRQRRQRVIDGFVKEMREAADIVRNEKVLSYGQS